MLSPFIAFVNAKLGKELKSCLFFSFLNENLNKEGNEVDTGGQFVELDNDGKPREIYRVVPKEPGLSKMNKMQLQDHCRLKDIPVTGEDGKFLTTSQLKDAIKAYRQVCY